MIQHKFAGRPDGWIPDSELDYFVVCPGCGQLVDMRDINQAMAHTHGKEIEFEWANSAAPGA